MTMASVVVVVYNVNRRNDENSRRLSFRRIIMACLKSTKSIVLGSRRAFERSFYFDIRSSPLTVRDVTFQRTISAHPPATTIIRIVSRPYTISRNNNGDQHDGCKNNTLFVPFTSGKRRPFKKSSDVEARIQNERAQITLIALHIHDQIRVIFGYKLNSLFSNSNLSTY